MLPLLLMLSDADPALARAQDKLRAERPCVVDPDTTDITVCGLRRADRFRVPFLVRTPGNPADEGVMAERVRLLHRTNPVHDLSPFLVGGGMAGVSVSTRLGPDGGTTVRKPAP